MVEENRSNRLALAVRRLEVKDARRFFLELAAKAPFFKSTDRIGAGQIEGTEVCCEGVVHPAFLAAYVIDSPIASLSHDRWTSSHLETTVSALDDEAEIVSFVRPQVNLAMADHYQIHADWFTERKNGVFDTAELWRRRAELFPHLTFCPSVEAQLSNVAPILPLLSKRLADLERVAASGLFEMDGFQSKCSRSAPSTLQQYENAYIFSTTAGEKIICGWHLMLPDARRIYFSPESTPYLIGYIGKHLPTTKFP